MRPRRPIALAVLLAAVLLDGAAAREKRATSPEALQAAARQFVGRLAAGDFATAYKAFDMTMKGALPPKKLGEVWQQINEQAGPFREQTGVRLEEIQKLKVVFVGCRFERALLEAKVVFDTAGQIAGLFFVPAPPASTSAPSHRPSAGPSAGGSDRAITIGSGRWALPGTLAMPSGGGPFPALVLLHGSGPHDRDETIGPNRPFRDLAGGLAVKGIAVLRYDKRTLVHGAAMAASGEAITLREEVIDDAFLAIGLLRGTAGIDRSRIFILGHSLGGVALPRIAAADPGIAGLILLATPSRPLEDVLLDQVAALAAMDGRISDEEARSAETLKRQVARVKDAAEIEKAAAGDLPLGLGRAYWRDLTQHPAPREMAPTRRPILVLQGGRDYQTTVVDFEGWKKALAGRGEAEFRFYPDLNHLFIAGRGRGGPADYQVAGRVAPAVIDDIAAWIGQR